MMEKERNNKLNRKTKIHFWARFLSLSRGEKEEEEEQKFNRKTGERTPAALRLYFPLPAAP